MTRRLLGRKGPWTQKGPRTASGGRWLVLPLLQGTAGGWADAGSPLPVGPGAPLPVLAGGHTTTMHATNRRISIQPLSPSCVSFIGFRSYSTQAGASHTRVYPSKPDPTSD